MRPILVFVLVLVGCVTPAAEPPEARWSCDPCARVLERATPPVWEPGAAADPNDASRIVVAYRDGSASTIVTSVTRDGGLTWSKGKFAVDGEADASSPASGWTHTGDAVVAFGPDGVVHLAGIGFRYEPDPAGVTFQRTGASIFVATSRDGGISFPDVSVVAEGSGRQVGAPPAPSVVTDYRNEDKEWLALGPDGTMLVTWTALHPGTGTAVAYPQREPNTLYASVSKDDGGSWSTPVAIDAEGSPSGSYPIIAADGTMHVAYRYYGEPRSFVATSKDGGASWTKIEVGEAVAQPTLAFAHGALLLAYPSDAGENAAPALARSEDGGATWSAPRRLGPASSGRAHVSLATAPSGIAYVGWYDDALGEPAYRVAALAGASGEAEILEVGPAEPDWARYGDYVTGLTALDDGFHAIWNHEGADGPVLHHARYVRG